METITTVKNTPVKNLKHRLVATAKKVKPYAIGAGIGIAATVVTSIGYAKSLRPNSASMDNDSIFIEEHDDGSFTVTQVVPEIPETPED